MSKGYVYVLGNAFMPGLVKIGKTTRTVEGRAFELYQTGVPAPFDVVFSAYSPDCHELEACVHEALADKRVNESREFFAIEAEDAKIAIKNALHEQLSIWLDEFAPEMFMVEDHFFVDPSVFWILSDALDASPNDICMSFHQITADEIRPALERVQAKYAQHNLRIVAE